MIFFFYKFFGKRYKADICGHKTKFMEEVEVFGEKRAWILRQMYHKHEHKMCLVRRTNPCKLGDYFVEIKGAIPYPLN